MLTTRRSMVSSAKQPPRARHVRGKGSDKPGRKAEQGQVQGGKSFSTGLFAGAVVGGLGIFMLDPQSGRRRRALVRDQVVHARHVADDIVTDWMPQKTDYLSGFVKGFAYRIGGDRLQPAANDKTLTDRVMSMVYRDPDIPKGELNLNTVDGVVYLRGGIDDTEVARRIEQKIREVEGVRDVVNLLGSPTDNDGSGAGVDTQ